MSAWTNQIWQAGQVNEGNVVRRSAHSVAQYGGGIAHLTAEVQQRGFHMARVGTQYVILCNQQGAIELIC